MLICGVENSRFNRIDGSFKKFINLYSMNRFVNNDGGRPVFVSIVNFVSISFFISYSFSKSSSGSVVMNIFVVSIFFIFESIP